MAEAPAMYDVAVVGLGPTGATLANLLGEAGLSVLVLEKEAGIFPLPRAIHFDGEVLRIFQALGLRDAVLAISRAGTQGMHFVNAAGETLMVRGGTQSWGPHGCASNYYFHQPELEAVLRQGLARYPQVKVLLQHELTGVQQDEDAATLRYRQTGQPDAPEQRVQARYVVGCDGARSPIRQHLQSPMVDLGLRQPWLVFDAVLNDAASLPVHTVQYCDPARPMTYCNVVRNRRRWEIMVLPDDDQQALLQPAALWQLLAPWVKPEQAQLERAAIYTFHSVIADGWRDRRLFLAGDACHQTPPFLGQGMCAGIRDASNLAWKLLAVLKGEVVGQASEDLLDSYEAERKPHVRALIELAVRLGNIIQTTDPVLAAERDARFKAGEPEVFELPRQVLSDERAGDEPALGQAFPQPQLADGRLLDELLGRHHAVIGHASALQSAAPETRARWQRAAVSVLAQDDPHLDAWLHEHKASAVVLRPDRYIVGIARTGADLDRISQLIPAAP